MKTKNVLFLFLISVLMNIAATSVTYREQLDYQEAPEVQIIRQADGTSKIIFEQGQDYEFGFTIPNGWYPINVPPTTEDIEGFNTLIEKENLDFPKISKEDFSSPSNEAKLLAFDLDPNHSTIDQFVAVAFINFTLPEIIPDWFISSIKYLEGTNGINKVDIKLIDGQTVGIVDFTIQSEDEKNIYQKVILFIRGGKMNIIGCITESEELIFVVHDFIDLVSPTLYFVSKQ